MTFDQAIEYANHNHIDIVDVRSPQEFAKGHIPHSRNVPLETMNKAFVTPGSYLVCQSGYHSTLASLELKRRGIKAISLPGGLNSYTGSLVVEDK